MQGCRRQPPGVGGRARLARAGQAAVLYLGYVPPAGADQRDADALRVRPFRRRLRLQRLWGAKAQRQALSALSARDRPQGAGGAVHRRRLARRCAGGCTGGHPCLASAERAGRAGFPAGRNRRGRRTGGVCAKPCARPRRGRRDRRFCGAGAAADCVVPVDPRKTERTAGKPVVFLGAGYVPDAPDLCRAAPRRADAVSASLPPQFVSALAATAGVCPAGRSLAPPASERRADRRILRCGLPAGIRGADV